MAGEVVCGWPGRLSADCPGSSADGDSPSRMVNVVKWWRAGSALAVGRPFGRLLDPSVSVDYRRRCPYRASPKKKKKGCAHAETVGGCARVHERIVSRKNRAT